MNRRPPRPQRSRRSYRPRFCSFCAAKVKDIDYKDTEPLKKLMSASGKIMPRRKTGTCMRHQRHLATAIERARHLALLPYTIL